jgi:hypothetical protein
MPACLLYDVSVFSNIASSTDLHGTYLTKLADYQSVMANPERTHTQKETALDAMNAARAAFIATAIGLPGLWQTLEHLPRNQWPTFSRGNCGYGDEAVMLKHEERWLPWPAIEPGQRWLNEGV